MSVNYVKERIEELNAELHILEDILSKLPLYRDGYEPIYCKACSKEITNYSYAYKKIRDGIEMFVCHECYDKGERPWRVVEKPSVPDNMDDLLEEFIKHTVNSHRDSLPFKILCLRLLNEIRKEVKGKWAMINTLWHLQKGGLTTS